jgi:uncharacterized protein YutE (UPF0331/DUF86 family)
MIDRELVTRKLLLVQQDLDALAPYARKPLSEYLVSPTDELVVERLLERSIGRLIDVNFHLLTESGRPPPSDYYVSFVELAALGVVDLSFARRVAACAGLRNRIAHEYDAIDPARVHAALETALLDLPEWMRCVLDFVERTAR